MGDFDNYTNTADKAGKAKPAPSPSANSFDGWEKKGVNDYPNLSPDVVDQVKSTQTLQKVTEGFQDSLNPTGAILKGVQKIGGKLINDKEDNIVPQFVKDAAKGYTETTEGFKKGVEDFMHDTTAYKVLSKVGLPEEDKAARDGRPGRVEPHGLCAFKQKVLNLCVQNAIVSCSQGITFCKMDAWPSPRIHGVGNPMNNPFLTIEDHVMFTNFFPYNLFTLCKNLANPFVAIATAAATAAKGGVFTLVPWPCLASAPLFNFFPWIPTQFKVLRGFVPVLTDKSKLLCWPGGIIGFEHHGQGLDASWAKAMFLGPGGIKGLLNLTNIASTGLGTAGGFLKEGSTAARFVNGAQATNDVVSAGLHTIDGDIDGAIKDASSAMGNAGKAAGDGSTVKKYTDFAGNTLDIAGVGWGVATGNPGAVTDYYLQKSLKDSGVPDDKVDCINSLRDLNQKTTEYTSTMGAGNGQADVLKTEADLKAITTSVDPEYGKITEQTFQQNEIRQAEIDKQMAQENSKYLETDEPSKPPKTVPLQKSSKDGTKMPSSDWNPSGNSTQGSTNTAAGTKMPSSDASAGKSSGNPFDLGDGAKYLD